MISVLVADDQDLVRSGLVALLSTADDICVVGEARDGGEVVRAVRGTRPVVVLIDIRMPVMVCRLF
jgi:YesN/AraC family two-component response regulator